MPGGVLATHGGKADQVTLNNGDRVTGAVVKKDAKTLTIKTEAFGLVMVGWDQVAGLQSDTPLHVALPGGETVQATLQTSQSKVELKETRQALALAEVVTLRKAEE